MNCPECGAALSVRRGYEACAADCGYAREAAGEVLFEPGDAVRLQPPGSQMRGIVRGITASGGVRVHWFVHGRADFIYRPHELRMAEHDPTGTFVIETTLF